MSNDAVFTMQPDPVPRDEFMTAVTSEDRPASQILRELMRSDIAQSHQPSEAVTCYRKAKAGVQHGNPQSGQPVGRTICNNRPSRALSLRMASRRSVHSLKCDSRSVGPTSDSQIWFLRSGF